MSSTPVTNPEAPSGLRRFSKIVSLTTLALIFVGGMVTSTSSGLSVPDWPLSYGMLFPPMVGGVFYEHGHRMVAALVGFLTLIQAFWLWRSPVAPWIKKLGWVALGVVILQGLLGGLTVLMFLPPPVSISHGVLAQTFFLITIVIAYALSVERQNKINGKTFYLEKNLLKSALLLTAAVYIQLILGALMRHTQSGLAIPDFPTMGGKIIASFDQSMLNSINDWRFEYNYPPVVMKQIVIHFLHRAWAIVILLLVLSLAWKLVRMPTLFPNIKASIIYVNSIIWIQIILGILTVLNHKSPVLTSLHVVTGATTLGLCMLLLLRAAPLSWKDFLKS